MVEYISREAALNFEMEIEADPDEIQAITKGMALYADYIKTVPAADVVPRADYEGMENTVYLLNKAIMDKALAEQKTGKWKRENLVATVGGTYSVVRCSECKAQFPFWETNFCPNCGAVMRGE